MADSRWSAEKANMWYREKGWQMGMNYLPAYAVNSTEMWQESTFDPVRIKMELAWARECGYMSLRVFLPFIVWEKEKENFIDHFAEFLSIARENRLNIMPILFDDCAFDGGQDPVYGPQPEPVPGVHNSRWTPSPGFAVSDDPERQTDLRNYVRAVVGRYRHDSAVLAWDLYNEPGNTNRFNRCLPLLVNAFGWARECAPEQPLTAGVWRGDFNTSEQIACLELSDIISYHGYTNADRQKETLDRLAGYGRPIFVTEWLCREHGSLIETHLPLYRERNVSCWNWGFVKGRTQTNLWWDVKDLAPDPWQHDILYPDGKPYREEEVALMKKYGQK